MFGISTVEVRLHQKLLVVECVFYMENFDSFLLLVFEVNEVH